MDGWVVLGIMGGNWLKRPGPPVFLTHHLLLFFLFRFFLFLFLSFPLGGTDNYWSPSLSFFDVSTLGLSSIVPQLLTQLSPLLPSHAQGHRLPEKEKVKVSVPLYSDG